MVKSKDSKVQFITHKEMPNLQTERDRGWWLGPRPQRQWLTSALGEHDLRMKRVRLP